MKKRLILEWLDHHPVTLLYAAKDPQCNHGVVLYEFILHKLGGQVNISGMDV